MSCFVFSKHTILLFLKIYEVLTDVISVLYVFTCAIRLFIYLLCNQEIRNAFYESFWGPLNGGPQNEYKPPVDKIAVSLYVLSLPGITVMRFLCRQRSQLGTDFDRLAIAIVTPRISSASGTQDHVHELLLKDPKNCNGNNYHSIENSIIIENPLAAIDDDSIHYDD